MDQAEKKRKLLLGAALVATLIAVVMVGDEEDAVQPVQSVASDQSSSRSRNARSNDTQRSDYLAIDQLGTRKFSAQTSELFRSTTWLAQRPKVKKRPNPFAQARAKAQAKAQADLLKKQAQQKIKETPPPLDFKYLGKVVEGNKTKVFLAQADEYHVVRLGGRLNKKYRVDGVNDEAVTLTYLPLGARQKLMINEKDAGMTR